MARIDVHSTHPLPEIKAHRGVWSLPLGDGTYLCSVAHDDEGVARHELSRHPAVLHVIPSHRSGASASDALVASVKAFIATQPRSSSSPAIPASPVAPYDLRSAVYAVTQDPIWHPDRG